MDVLQYYTPDLNWSAFKKGALATDVWTLFREIVLLSHAHKHWSAAARKHRMSRPPAALHQESSHTKRKRRQEWDADGDRLDNHRHRAAFLAAERLWQLASLVQHREGTPDQILGVALMNAVGPHIMNTLTGHERADFEALTFTAFDADAEVVGEPKHMATRWRRSAGINDVP